MGYMEVVGEGRTGEGERELDTKAQWLKAYTIRMSTCKNASQQIMMN